VGTPSRQSALVLDRERSERAHRTKRTCFRQREALSVHAARMRRVL
jgi:hypothetical protein